jgi:hypothetical protein
MLEVYITHIYEACAVHRQWFSVVQCEERHKQHNVENRP